MNFSPKLYYLLLLVSLVATSCSKDDDNDSEEVSNTIEHNGVFIDVSDTLIEDYGSFEGYYNYDFYLSGTSDDDVLYDFYAELYSKGTDAFKAGVFSYVPNESPTELPDFYYRYSDIQLGANIYKIVSGDIEVSLGDGNNYYFSGDLTLNNGETLSINYDGEFTIVDETD